MQEINSPPRGVWERPFRAASNRIAAFMQQPRLLLLLFTFLALSLRLYKLTFWNYWDDEVISTFAARASPQEVLFSIVDYSVHPPFYYLLLHFWMLFGDDLFTIRLFSVLISSACVPLIYLLGREMLGKQTALVAALIMAVAPFHIVHGQQARMYPLLTLLVLAITWFFLRAWRHGNRIAWAGFALCVVCGLYTHVYFAFSLLALNLYALYDTYRQRRIAYKQWGYMLIAQFIGVLAFLPFVPQLFQTVSGVVEWYWIHGVTVLDWMFILTSLSNYATITMRDQAPRWYLLGTYIPGVGMVVIALFYSLREVLKRSDGRSDLVLLHMNLWTPIVIAMIISLTIKPIMLDRSLIAVSSPLYLLMAWVIIRHWHAWAIRIVAVLFLGSSLIILAYIYPDTPQANSLVRMAAYLAAEQQPGDAIAFADWQSFDTTFLMHPDLEDVYVLPAPARSRMQFAGRAEWLARLRYMRWPHLEHVQPVAEFAPAYERVWLVLTNYTYTIDYQREVNQAWLEAHGQLVEQWDFNRATVFLYDVEPQQ